MHKNAIAAKIGILEPNFSQITTVVLCPSVTNLPSKFHSVWKDFSEKKANHDQTSYYLNVNYKLITKGTFSDSISASSEAK